MNTTAAPAMTAVTVAPTVTAHPPTPAGVAPSRLRALLDRYGQFFLYAVIGGGAVLIDVGLFALLATAGGMHVLLANTVSTAVAIVYSFVANSFGNFKVTDRLLLRFASFAAVSGVGFVVSTLMIGVSVGLLSMDPILAKAITLPVVLVLQFTLNKTVTFGSRLGRTAS